MPGLGDAPPDVLWRVMCWLSVQDRLVARSTCRCFGAVRRCGDTLVLRGPPSRPDGDVPVPAWLLAEGDVARPARLVLAFARALGAMLCVSRWVVPTDVVQLGPALGLCEAHAALVLWPDVPVVLLSSADPHPYGLAFPPISPRVRLASLVVAHEGDAAFIPVWRPLVVSARDGDVLDAVFAAMATYDDGELNVHAHSGHGDHLSTVPIPSGVRVASVCWTGAPTPLLDRLLARGCPARLRLGSTDTTSLCWRRWWPAVAAQPSLTSLQVPAVPPPRWLACVFPGLRSLSVEEGCDGRPQRLGAVVAGMPQLREIRVCCCCRMLRQLVQLARGGLLRRRLTVRFSPAPLGCGTGTPVQTQWYRELERAVLEPRLRVAGTPAVPGWPLPPGLARLIQGQS